MKKILFILSVACLLTGCGKKETVSTPVEETVAESQVVESTSEDVSKDTPEANANEHTHEDISADTSETNEKEESVVGLTFKEAEEKGVYCSSYMGFNGEYIFCAKSEDGLVKYEITSGEADGFEQVGHIGNGVNGLILRKDNFDIVIYLDDSCKEISENTDFEKIDHNKHYEVYTDCYVTEAVYW